MSLRLDDDDDEDDDDDDDDDELERFFLSFFSLCFLFSLSLSVFVLSSGFGVSRSYRSRRDSRGVSRKNCRLLFGLGVLGLGRDKINAQRINFIHATKSD